MTTINNAVFLSDDEEDESFHGSDVSSEDERESLDNDFEIPSNKKEKTLNDVIKNRKIDKIYRELVENVTKELYNRKSTVRNDDFMLEFQRKYFDMDKRRNSNIDDLNNYINLGISKVFENPIEFNISKYKQISRSLDKETEDETREMIEKALGNIDNKNVNYVERTVRYAGETYTIKEKIDPSTHSRKSRKISNEVSKSMTGMASLDKIISELEKSTSINSIQKSQSDWLEFRQMAGIESQLERQRKYGYISKAAFLQKADWKLHEKELELKRKTGNANIDKVSQ